MDGDENGMRRRGRAEGRERAPGSEPGGPSRARPPTVTRSGTLKVDRGITPPRSESCGGGLTRLRIETLLVVLISRSCPLTVAPLPSAHGWVLVRLIKVRSIIAGSQITIQFTSHSFSMAGRAGS